MQSLISNSTVHGPAHGAVYVVCVAQGDALAVTVSNLVAPDTHRGLGVGTYMCTKLAEQLGATLSTARDGTEYHVRLELPLASEADIAALS